MNMGGDENFCWLCSMAGCCCSCKFSSLSWLRSTSQESLCSLGVDERGLRTIDESCFLGGTFENTNFGTDDAMRCPGGGLQQPCASSTPKNNNYVNKWGPPGAMAPPSTSSPVGPGTDCSPFSTALAPPMSRREGVPIEGELLHCHSCDNSQLNLKAPFNDCVPSTAPASPLIPSRSSAPTFQTQTDMGARLKAQDHLADSPQRSSSVPSFGVAQESLDAHLGTLSGRQGALDDIPLNVYDICAVTTQTTLERTNNLEKPNEISSVSAWGCLVPTSRRSAISSGPTIIDLEISTELESALSHNTEVDGLYDTATTSNETNRSDGVLSKMLPSTVPIIPVSCSAQATLDSRAKRHRSSIDSPPESKKVKLDRFASHVSSATDSSVEFKYRATEPASIRRAQSLRSEVSTCSEGSTDLLFYPSPLSSPTSRPCLEKDYPPTIPNTPLPNSVDYTRSKANPLIRTVAVYRHGSLKIPAIPPVPIIAPPTHITPTVICCAEDQAIDRLQALLLRERLERKRDGLNVHDEQRTERLKALYATDPAFPRRTSDTTSDSSDDCGQWEEESTLSAIELKESQNSAPSAKNLPGQHRVVSREVWSNAFGITNDFRKEVTEWILKKLPNKPILHGKLSRDECYLGTDLYDQLASSHQTRFHAAQLFHRYFLLPQKVKFWREICKDERCAQEYLEMCDDSHWERRIWSLAVACMALSVKLHRDCLPPLGPVYASQFLDMAPYSTTHEAFELAQRDVMHTFQFLLGSCTPQDVLDELWNASPTLRKATAPIRDGWAVVQCVTWDKLFESLYEPDMLQYPISLLTAAALIDSLVIALSHHYKTEADVSVCKCKGPAVGCDTEPTSWQIYLFEATQLVDDVILDVKDVLQLSDMELDECRMWLSNVGQ